MSSPEEQISQLKAAIEAQESMRATLGDAVVDTTIAALRNQLNARLEQQKTTTRPQVSTEQLLERLLPKELADKIRVTGRVEGERKQVTVVFADMSGFTALGERLDPEVIRAFQNDLFSEMAQAVYQYEGYIDKFIGDAIMAVFGAPIAHEDDPERALRTALALRERLEHLNRQWSQRLGQSLSLHIGVNTGTVIAGELGPKSAFSYTVTGDTVNTASRLETAALPGQILVSRETYRLTQGAFDFVALEPIRVKGKREPIAIFELQRAKLNPLKVRGLKELDSVFVGREREQTQLQRVVDDLLAGQGHIVTVTGEAGIGKSRLMAEWRAQVGERARWLEGRSFAHTSSVAYGPFLDLFRRFAGIQDEDSETTARSRLNSALQLIVGDDVEAHALFASMLTMRLSPEESEIIAAMPAQVVRQRLFNLINDLFERYANTLPIVLVLEDMHWADTTSIELAEHLLPLTAHLPIAIVSVFRGYPNESTSQLMATIKAQRAERWVQLRLTPLSESSSLEMAERLLSLPVLPASLRQLILNKAEGNPFFVEEVIRTLIERGALMRRDGDWEATPIIESISVPDTLQGLLMARLDRLPDETKWVVQQASVIGRIFLYRVLLQMAESHTSLDADISHLEREELIRERAHDPELEYIFKHALTQEVSYQSLLAPRRKELHRRAGEAMEIIFAGRLSEFYSVIGQHMLYGEAWERAADYLSKAGDNAARIFANAEARQHYAEVLKALSHLPDNDDNRRRRIDITMKLVNVSLVTEDPANNLARLKEVEPIAQALFAATKSSDDELRLARVHYGMGRAHHYRADLREAVGFYREALAVGQRYGDEELTAIPASVIGQALCAQGQWGKAAALLAQAIPLLEKSANWQQWIRSLIYHGLAIAARGQFAEGLAENDRALARALELKDRTSIGVTYVIRSLVFLMGGDMPKMLESALLLRPVAEQAGDRMYVWVTYGYEGWAQSRLGELQKGVEAMARQAELQQELGGRIILGDWFAAADAEIALCEGRVADALAMAEKTVATGTAIGSVFSPGLAHRTWAQALAASSPPQWDAAEQHMAESARLLESGEALLEAARTHVAWGVLCRDRAHHAAARDHFEKAIAQFDAAGLAVEAQQTRQLNSTLES